MWQKVTDAVGVAARDSLWDYPDLQPTADDIDDPTALIERLQARARGEAPVADEFDEALSRLLAGDDFSEEAASDDASEAGPGDEKLGDDERGDGKNQGGETPV